MLDTACRQSGPTIAPADVPLHRAYTAQAGRLEIGDGRHLRFHLSNRPGLGKTFDTGWLPLGSSGRVVGDHTPTVRVTVELGALALAVRDCRGDADRP